MFWCVMFVYYYCDGFSCCHKPICLVVVLGAHCFCLLYFLFGGCSAKSTLRLVLPVSWRVCRYKHPLHKRLMLVSE